MAKTFEIKVPKGATASTLARKYKTSLDKIEKLNPKIAKRTKGLDLIYAGESMKLPKLKPVEAPEAYKEDFESELENLYKGQYGMKMGREKMGKELEKEYPQIDVWEDIYTKIPDHWEENKAKIAKDLYPQASKGASKLKKDKQPAWYDIGGFISENVLKPVKNAVRDTAISIAKKVDIPTPKEVYKTAKDIVKAKLIKPTTETFSLLEDTAGEIDDTLEGIIKKGKEFGRDIKRKFKEGLADLEEDIVTSREELSVEFEKEKDEMLDSLPVIGPMRKKAEEMKKEKKKGAKKAKKGISVEELKKDPEVAVGYMEQVKWDTLDKAPELKEKAGIVIVETPEGALDIDLESTTEASKKLEKKYVKPYLEEFDQSDPLVNQALDKQGELFDTQVTLVRELTTGLNKLWFKIQDRPEKDMKKLTNDFNKIIEQASYVETARPTLASLDVELERVGRSSKDLENYYKKQLPKWWDEVKDNLGDSLTKALQSGKELSDKQHQIFTNKLTKLKPDQSKRTLSLLNMIGQSQTFYNIETGLSEIVKNPEKLKILKKLYPDKGSSTRKAIDEILNYQEWWKKNETQIKDGFLTQLVKANSSKSFNKLEKEIKANEVLTKSQTEVSLNLLKYFRDKFEINKYINKQFQRLGKASKLYVETSKARQLKAQKKEMKKIQSFLEKPYKTVLFPFTKATRKDFGTFLKYGWGWFKNLKIPLSGTRLKEKTFEMPSGAKVSYLKPGKAGKLTVSESFGKAIDLINKAEDWVYQNIIPAYMTTSSTILGALEYEGRAELAAPFTQIKTEEELRSFKDLEAFKQSSLAPPNASLPPGTTLEDAARLGLTSMNWKELYEFYRSPAAYEEITLDEKTRIKLEQGKVRIGNYVFDNLTSREQLWSLNPHIKDIYVIPKGTKITVPRFRRYPRFSDAWSPTQRYEFYKEHPGMMTIFDEVAPFIVMAPFETKIWTASKLNGIKLAKFLGFKPISQTNTILGSVKFAQGIQKSQEVVEPWIKLMTFKGVDWDNLPAWTSRLKPGYKQTQADLVGTTIAHGFSGPAEPLAAFNTQFGNKLREATNLRYLSMEAGDAIFDAAKKEGKSVDLVMAELSTLLQDPTLEATEASALVARKLGFSFTDLSEIGRKYPLAKDPTALLRKAIAGQEKMFKQLAFKNSYQRLGDIGKDFYDSVIAARMNKTVFARRAKEPLEESYQNYLRRWKNYDNYDDIKEQVDKAKSLVKMWDEETENARKIMKSAKTTLKMPQKLDIVPSSAKVLGEKAKSFAKKEGRLVWSFNPDKYPGRIFGAVDDALQDYIDLRLTNLEEVSMARVGNVLLNPKKAIAKKKLYVLMKKGKRVGKTLNSDQWVKRFGKKGFWKRVKDGRLSPGTKKIKVTKKVKGKLVSTMKEISFDKVPVYKTVFAQNELPTIKVKNSIMDEIFNKILLNKELKGATKLRKFLQNLGTEAEDFSRRTFKTQDLRKLKNVDDVRDGIKPNSVLDQVKKIKGKQRISWNSMRKFVKQAAEIDYLKQSTEGKRFLTRELSYLRTRPQKFMDSKSKLKLMLLETFGTGDKPILPKATRILILEDTLTPTRLKTVKSIFKDLADKFAKRARKKAKVTLGADEIKRRQDLAEKLGFKKNKFTTFHEISKWDNWDNAVKVLKDTQKTYNMAPRSKEINEIIPKLRNYLPAVRMTKDEIAASFRKTEKVLVSVVRDKISKMEDAKTTKRILKVAHDLKDPKFERKFKKLKVFTSPKESAKLSTRFKHRLRTAAKSNKIQLIQVTDFTAKDKAIIKYLKKLSSEFPNLRYQVLSKKGKINFYDTLRQNEMLWQRATLNGAIRDDDLLELMRYLPKVPEWTRSDNFPAMVIQALKKTKKGRRLLSKFKLDLDSKAKLIWNQDLKDYIRIDDPSLNRFEDLWDSLYSGVKGVRDHLGLTFDDIKRLQRSEKKTIKITKRRLSNVQEAMAKEGGATLGKVPSRFRGFVQGKPELPKNTEGVIKKLVKLLHTGTYDTKKGMLKYYSEGLDKVGELTRKLENAKRGFSRVSKEIDALELKTVTPSRYSDETKRLKRLTSKIKNKMPRDISFNGWQKRMKRVKKASALEAEIKNLERMGIGVLADPKVKKPSLIKAWKKAKNKFKKRGYKKLLKENRQYIDDYDNLLFQRTLVDSLKDQAKIAKRAAKKLAKKRIKARKLDLRARGLERTLAAKKGTLEDLLGKAGHSLFPGTEAHVRALGSAGDELIDRKFLDRINKRISSLKESTKSLRKKIDEGKEVARFKKDLVKANKEIDELKKLEELLPDLKKLQDAGLKLNTDEIWKASRGVVKTSLKRKIKRIENALKKKLRPGPKGNLIPLDKNQKKLYPAFKGVKEQVEDINLKRAPPDKILNDYLPRKGFLGDDYVLPRVGKHQMSLESKKLAKELTEASEKRGVKVIVDLEGNISPGMANQYTDAKLIQIPELSKKASPYLTEAGEIPFKAEGKGYIKLRKIFKKYKNIEVWDPDLDRVKKITDRFTDSYISPTRKKAMKAAQDIAHSKNRILRKAGTPGFPAEFPRREKAYLKAIGEKEPVKLSKFLRPEEKAIEHMYTQAELMRGFKNMEVALRKSDLVKKLRRGASTNKIHTLVISELPDVTDNQLRKLLRSYKKGARYYLPKKLKKGEKVIKEYFQKHNIPFTQIDETLDPKVFDGNLKNWDEKLPSHVFNIGKRFKDPARRRFYETAKKGKRLFKPVGKIQDDLVKAAMEETKDALKEFRKEVSILKLLDNEDYGLMRDAKWYLAKWKQMTNRYEMKKYFNKTVDKLVDESEARLTTNLLRETGRMKLSKTDLRRINLRKNKLSRITKKLKMDLGPEKRFGLVDEAAKLRKEISTIELNAAKGILSPKQKKLIKHQRRIWEDLVDTHRYIYKWDSPTPFWEEIEEAIAKRLKLSYTKERNLYLMNDLPMPDWKNFMNSTAFWEKMLKVTKRLPQVKRAALTPFGIARSIWINSVLYYRPAWHFRNSYSDAIRSAIASKGTDIFFRQQAMFSQATAVFARKLLGDLVDDVGLSWLMTPKKAERLELEKLLGSKRLAKWWNNTLLDIAKRPYKPFTTKSANKAIQKGLLRHVDDKLWKKDLSHAMSLEEMLEKGPILTPKGEWLTKDILDHLTEAGLAQIYSDPVRQRKMLSFMSESNWWKRLKKRAAVTHIDVQTYANVSENMRRQLLVYDLLFKKSMSLAKTKMKTWGHLFNYRDLTIVGKSMRYFFPFYAFNTKSAKLWLKIAGTSPSRLFAARGLLEAWEEATRDLPEWMKNRVPVGNQVYHYPWTSAAQVAYFFRDPVGQLKKFAENPLQIPLGFGWSPFWTSFLNTAAKKEYFDIAPEVKKRTGWTDAEVDKWIKKQGMDRDISDDFYKVLINYVPFVKAIKTLNDVDQTMLIDGTSLLKSKKIREFEKMFGLNLMKWNDMDKARTIYFDTAPHKRKIALKSQIKSEMPHAWTALKNYWAKTAYLKAAEKAKEKPVEATHDLQMMSCRMTYFDLEEEKEGKGKLWLENCPHCKKELDKYFEKERQTTPASMMDQAKYNRGKLATQVRSLSDKIFKEVVFDRAEVLGIDIPFGIPGKKKDFLPLFFDKEGEIKISTKEELEKIMGHEWADKIENRTKKTWQELIKETAKVRYHEWLREKVEGKTKEDKLFAKKMSLWQAILPSNLAELPEKKANKYWKAYWNYFEKYFSEDQKTEYFMMLKDRKGEWYVEYRKRMREYVDLWGKIFAEGRKKKNKFQFFEEFYDQPQWFKNLYFAEHPNKKKWYPMARKWTSMLFEIEEKEKETGIFQEELRQKASNYFWEHENIVKNYWDKDNPGFYDYMKTWQKVIKVSEANPEKYFDTFYKQDQKFKDRFFERNPDKEKYYPFVHQWIQYIEADQKSWQEKRKRTTKARDYFWSKKNKKLRELYGKHKKIDPKHTLIDYLKIWDKIFYNPEDRVWRDIGEGYFDIFYSKPKWFRKHFFLTNPNKKIYYPVVQDWIEKIQLDENNRKQGKVTHKARDYFRSNIAGKKKIAKAWEKSNPGIINYLKTWNKIIEITEKNPENYYKLFYQQDESFRERFFKSNPEKGIYYPKVAAWVEAIKLDEKNWEEKNKRTHIARDQFNSWKNTKAGKLYGRHNPITKKKNMIDYLEIWQEVMEKTEENPADYFKLFDKQPNWFKDHYLNTHPLKAKYYPFARKLGDQAPEEFGKFFWKAKYKKAREAWFKDKPEFKGYMKFWKKLSSFAKTDQWNLYLNFYFAKKNKKWRKRHWRNHPEAETRFKLFREYQGMPAASFEERRKKRKFLKRNPELIKWWSEDLSEEEAEMRKKIEKYFSYGDKIPAEGKGKSYYLKVRKWNLAQEFYLKENPEVQIYLQKHSKKYTGEKKEIYSLVKDYFEIELPSDRKEFLEDNPEIKDYFQRIKPPGIREVIKLQNKYFKLPTEIRDSFLKVHPELLDYWEVNKLPYSYFWNKKKFKPWSDLASKVEKMMKLYQKVKWVEAESFREILPKRWEKPGDTEEAEWFKSQIYGLAMETWAGLIKENEFISIYYFRQLPDWVRDLYYSKHPENKYLSKYSLSRFIEEPLRIEEALTGGAEKTGVVWARKMMTKYGKNLPSNIKKKVRKIMIDNGEWKDRSGWGDKEWDAYWEKRSLELNQATESDLENLPLFRKELTRVKKNFPHRLFRKPFRRPRIGLVRSFY